MKFLRTLFGRLLDAPPLQPTAWAPPAPTRDALTRLDKIAADLTAENEILRIRLDAARAALEKAEGQLARMAVAVKDDGPPPTPVSDVDTPTRHDLDRTQPAELLDDPLTAGLWARANDGLLEALACLFCGGGWSEMTQEARDAFQDAAEEVWDAWLDRRGLPARPEGLPWFEDRRRRREDQTPQQWRDAA